jgi:hypothetical protein
VEISSSIIVFCRVDGDVGMLEDECNLAKMLVSERLPAASRRAFQGDLSEIPAAALLQLLEMGRKSGLLELTSCDGKGRLWIERGRPVHAETERALGLAAAVALLTNARGRFRFEPQVGTEEHTFTTSVAELLLEARRLQDEAAR